MGPFAKTLGLVALALFALLTTGDASPVALAQAVPTNVLARPTNTPLPIVAKPTNTPELPIAARATSTPPLGVVAKPTSTPTPPARVTPIPDDLPKAVPSATPTPLSFTGPSPTPTPWSFPGNEASVPPVPNGDLAIVKIDVIQSVSRPAFGDLPPAPLVAHKDTLVRVWVTADADEDRLVLVNLSVTRNGEGVLPCGAATQQAIKLVDNAVTETNLEAFTESNLWRTVNFQIPGSCPWLAPGDIKLTATVEGLECTQCGDNNSLNSFWVLHDVRPLRLRMSLVTYYEPGSPNHGKAPGMTLEGLDDLISIFPINDVEIVGWGSWSTEPPLDELGVISLDDPGLTLTEWVERYETMIDWFRYTHWESDLGVDSDVGLIHPDVVGCKGVGKWDSVLSGAGCGFTYAHEIGHNFGLPHASNAHNECDGGACDPDWPFTHGMRNGFGWYPAKPEKLIAPSFSNGTHSHDLMSYGGCGAAPGYSDNLATYCQSWLSLLNYGRIGQRLECADPQGSLNLDNHFDELCWNKQGAFATLIDPANQTTEDEHPAPGPKPPGPTEETGVTLQTAAVDAPQPLPQTAGFIRVAGRLLADDTLELWPSYIGPSVGAPSPSSPRSVYEIQLRDATDAVIARHGFAPRASSGHGSPHRNRSFDERIPWHPNTRKIAIVRSGFVLGERIVSANAPSVHVLSPNGGEAWPATGPVTVTWEASDPDGDALRYWLEHSPDGGKSWETIVSNVRGSSYTLQGWEVPGGSQALVRVRATDGVLTTADTSDATFAVANKPPVVAIVGGRETLTLAHDGFLDLRGLGADLDGGMLRGSALVWTSDRAGRLGTGASVRLERLAPGPHRITLEGTDRDGQTATAETTVIVQ